MDRTTLAKEVIDTANTLNGYVFGGYVRDLVAGERFNDVDIFLPQKSFVVDDFVKSLKNKGFKVVKRQSGNLYNIPNIARTKFVIRSGMNAVNVDVVVSMDPANDSPFRKDMDPDVNYLYMDSNATIKVATCLGVGVGTVSDHIQNRQYVASDKVTDFRIDKIEMKGYKRIHESEKPLKFTVIKSRGTIPGVCPECQGSGELDFGFYKRTCGCKLR